MVRTARFRFVLGAAAALLTMGIVASTAVMPALAAGVSKVHGSAYGYRAYNIRLFGGSRPGVGPTPAEMLATNAKNSPASASSTTGLVEYGPATLFTSDSISLQSAGSRGAAGNVSGTTTVTDINEASTEPTTGSEALTADSISSSCAASASGKSGSTTITNGTVVTDNSSPPVVVTLPANPAVDYTVTGVVHISSTQTDSFKYVFNEHTTSNGVLTVNAVHEYFLGPDLKGNLIIGQVACGVTLN